MSEVRPHQRGFYQEERFAIVHRGLGTFAMLKGQVATFKEEKQAEKASKLLKMFGKYEVVPVAIVVMEKVKNPAELQKGNINDTVQR